MNMVTANVGFSNRFTMVSSSFVTEDEMGEIKVESDGVLCATGCAYIPEKIPSAPELRTSPRASPDYASGCNPGGAASR